MIFEIINAVVGAGAITTTILSLRSLWREQRDNSEAFHKVLEVTHENVTLKVDLAHMIANRDELVQVVEELKVAVNREKISRELAEGQRNDIIKALGEGGIKSGAVVAAGINSELQALSQLSTPKGGSGKGK